MVRAASRPNAERSHLPLLRHRALHPRSVASTASADSAETVLPMPHEARNRHWLNAGATPSNSTGDAPENHARRQSWKQPHTAKAGRWQRAQPSQKGYPHDQPAAWEKLSGVTLSYPSNYANAPRAGSARGPQHPHREKPDTCLHTPPCQGPRLARADMNSPTFRGLGKEKRQATPFAT